MFANVKKLCCLTFLLFTVLTAPAQNISIPHFESVNTFYGIGSSPYIGANSVSDLILRFSPSHILYMDLSINADIQKLLNFFSPVSDYRKPGKFDFLGASVNFPHIKNNLLSVGVFTGFYDYLGSDSLLQEHIKEKLPEPDFRKRYPASAFRPQNTVKGTGFTVHGALKSGFYMGLYSYWNEELRENLRISGDVRFGGNFDFFSFDFFAGAALPLKIKQSEFRTGITMLFKADDYYEFFTEAGVAKISIADISPNLFMSNFYASFEARIKHDKVNTAIACFISPVFLLPAGINDPALKDSFFTGLNTMLTFGSLNLYNVEGGFSVLASVNPQKPALITPFSFSISPFIAFKINKIEFDCRIPINPLMYNNLKQMFTGQISIKAVF
ncbi:hypothetical protein [Treponema pedis]|uniref:DUF5723 domain-containing protein n=1 Tax=Treponema pedis str. T A4 TaxID=1291379 RepID=S5ZZC8_9SPIR|nr:hypothetical protein [Treponema pedis]AGT43593.1 hypothetical protein TPE_1097 [Treponema pedis str. T A4]QSI04382.1 hypothetical protein DYQ05_05240 [Treponema pedis]